MRRLASAAASWLSNDGGADAAAFGLFLVAVVGASAALPGGEFMVGIVARRERADASKGSWRRVYSSVILASSMIRE
jgi:hypothetical protein